MTTRLLFVRWGVVALIATYVLAIAILQVLWRTSALNVWWLSLLNVFGLWLYAPLPLLILLGLLLAFITIGYNLYQLATVRLGPSRPPKPAAAQSSQSRRPPSNWDDDERDEDDDWPVRRRTDG